VVTLYLLWAVNYRLRPKLFRELRPGARVVSHKFDMGQWKPDSVVHTTEPEATVYYWVDPDTGAALYHTGVNDEATNPFFPDVGAAETYLECRADTGDKEDYAGFSLYEAKTKKVVDAVDVLTVLEPTEAGDAAPVEAPGPTAAERDAGDAGDAANVARVRLAGRATVEALTREGDPAAVVRSVAAERDADVVALGPHGGRPEAGPGPGPVTTAVLEAIDRPVVVLPVGP
jgi:nucleotide-binding universal stress UspA family protein